MVRSAAVGTMGDIYKHIGDRVWKQAGNLQPAAKDLLAQRFRTIDLTGDSTSFDKTESPEEIIQTPDKVASKTAATRSPSLPKLRGLAGTIATITKTPLQDNKRERRQSSIDMTDKPINPYPEPQEPDSPDDSELQEIELELRASTSTAQRESNDFPLRLTGADSVDSSRISDVYESLCEEDFIAALKSELSKMTPLERAIQTLCKGEMAEKVDALVNLNEILSDPKSLSELCVKSDMILEGLGTVAMDTFIRVPVPEIPVRFAKYYLNIVYKASATIAMVREASEQSLIMLIQTLLK